eukprot:8386476-Lingulodinium_polyedra.AAC.1
MRPRSSSCSGLPAVSGQTPAPHQPPASRSARVPGPIETKILDQTRGEGENIDPESISTDVP